MDQERKDCTCELCTEQDKKKARIVSSPSWLKKLLYNDLKNNQLSEQKGTVVQDTAEAAQAPVPHIPVKQTVIPAPVPG